MWFSSAVWIQTFLFFSVYFVQWKIYNANLSSNHYDYLYGQLRIEDSERAIFYTSIGVAAVFSVVGSEFIMGWVLVGIKMMKVRARAATRPMGMPVPFYNQPEFR